MQLCTSRNHRSTITKKLTEQVTTLMKTLQLMKSKVQMCLREQKKKLRPLFKQFILRKIPAIFPSRLRRMDSGCPLEKGWKKCAHLVVAREIDGNVFLGVDWFPETKYVKSNMIIFSPLLFIKRCTDAHYLFFFTFIVYCRPFVESVFIEKCLAF